MIITTRHAYEGGSMTYFDFCDEHDPDHCVTLFAFKNKIACVIDETCENYYLTPEQFIMLTMQTCIANVITLLSLFFNVNIDDINYSFRKLSIEH